MRSRFIAVLGLFVAVIVNSELIAVGYVTNTKDDSVSVIRTSDNTVTGTVTVGSSPRGLALTPNGAYVSQTVDQVMLAS